MNPEDARKLVNDLETAAIVQWYSKGGYVEKDKNYNRLQHARKALLKALTEDNDSRKTISHDEAVELYKKLRSGHLSAAKMVNLEVGLQRRKVIAFKYINYGDVEVPRSTIGTITDFDANGSPIVEWDYRNAIGVVEIGVNCRLLD